ncbi:MAG: ferrous iron transport protein B [Deltaproteobacteria bacterium]|nr:ferrous iron transport protein B [Deltaproteobacteria bacterium]MBW2304935.1 ferrous iron transport protein B [Deltaproteobacteria bacterium]
MSKKKIRIALSGNPNSGKTTIFNALTGARQHIANYPGVTVEKKYGRTNHQGYEIEVVDLPGIYSLTAYSLEEIVARDYLLDEKPDVVVDIVDASNLDRNLYLALQFKELGVPLIIALNMMDVASSRGITIDTELLSHMLNAPVVPMVARTRSGIKALLDKVLEVAEREHEWHPELISYGGDIDQALDEIEEILQRSRFYDEKYAPRWLALKCVEGDDQVLRLMEREPILHDEIEAVCRRVSRHILNTLEEEPEGIIADHRYGYIAGITRKAVKRKIQSRLHLSDRLDKVLTDRILGPIIMLVVLYATYEFIFWASEAPVAWTESFFEWLKEVIFLVLPPGNLRSLLTSGVIDGVGGVLGFVPLIMFMFLAIAVMEDAGYMARVAYMLDRVLRWFGLHGNSVLAFLISGGISGGCAVPGILATRTLRDPKERITTILVVPFMNCGAKLPLFGVLIAAFFSKNEARMLFIFTLLSWAFALFSAKIIRSTVLRGPKTPFVMELPPYRVPTLKGLAIHTWERTWQYIKKAGTVILGFSILLWAVMTFPQLPQEQRDHYRAQRDSLEKAFLSHAQVRGLIHGKKELALLDKRFSSLIQDKGKGKETVQTDHPHSPVPALAEAAFRLKNGGRDLVEGMDPGLIKAAKVYLDYQEAMAQSLAFERRDALLHAFAGRIGKALETITRPLGFDYRVNIALIGGFAAKEIIVSTLGTAYSLGDTDSEEGTSLSDRLRNNPDWNPLKAFTLVIFSMLYVPCFVTLAMIRKEASWKWAGFSVAFNLLIAYTFSLFLYQVGSFLGLGL